MSLSILIEAKREIFGVRRFGAAFHMHYHKKIRPLKCLSYSPKALFSRTLIDKKCVKSGAKTPHSKDFRMRSNQEVTAHFSQPRRVGIVRLGCLQTTVGQYPSRVLNQKFSIFFTTSKHTQTKKGLPKVDLFEDICLIWRSDLRGHTLCTGLLHSKSSTHFRFVYFYLT